MKQSYRNPYQANLPDHQASPRYRQAVMQMLESRLMYSEEIPCISIVSERGMGGSAIVRKFLSHYARELPLRIVQCNVKTDLGQGGSAADFYRALATHIRRRLPNLPDIVVRAAERLAANPSSDFKDLDDDMWNFFDGLRMHEQPLLFVFYYFDRLPGNFKLSGPDLNPLRVLNEDRTNPRLKPVYYLVVSRRPLEYIEQLHGLQQSLFATRFLSPYHVGLLEEQDAHALIVEPGQSVLDRTPWDQSLAGQIFTWGGRHPYCTELICATLFEDIWIHGKQVDSGNVQEIAHTLRSKLYPYFDRLHRNLKADGLLDPLLRALEPGGVPLSPDIRELIDLGYFLPEPAWAANRKYELFSPLFYWYLVDRGLLLGRETQLPDNSSSQKKEEMKDLTQNPLTGREREVLRLLVAGKTYQEIAYHINISINTVKKHLGKIYEKLNVRSRTDAVRVATERHLV